MMRILSTVFFILTCFSAFAVNISPFIGGNIGLNGVTWSDEAKDTTDRLGFDLPTSFFGLGGEAGVKFASDNVYNATVTFSYDYIFNQDADIEWYAKDYVLSAESGFSVISLTYDNYLRVSGKAAHRQDIVLGAGLGRVTERVKVKFTDEAKLLYGLQDIDGSDWGMAVVIKVGYNYKMLNNMDLYLNGRWFIPTSSNGDFEALFNGNVGIRYVF